MGLKKAKAWKQIEQMTPSTDNKYKIKMNNCDCMHTNIHTYIYTLSHTHTHPHRYFNYCCKLRKQFFPEYRTDL